MSGMHDSWFFIGIFVFIFLIWIITGGPVHPLAFSGPTLAQPDVLGGGTYLSLPRASGNKGTGLVSLPGSSDGKTVSTDLKSSLLNVSAGTASRYRDVVYMQHYVSSAGATNPGDEYISLKVSKNATTPINISGWTLQSDTSGNVVTIPKGTEVPRSGLINASQNIMLSGGDQIMIISGRSPIGASFRENKCIGYFSTFQKFSPPLPQNCPVPENELPALYGPDYIRDVGCIDYVKTLNRCQATLSPPINVSGACQSFLEKNLNYNGCVVAHQNEPDFKGSSWRIYLGRSGAMWRPKHEIVRLLDTTGKTVDVFSY